MTTILISILVLWTVFGLFILFNHPSIDECLSNKFKLFKLGLALGPVLFVVGVIAGSFFIGVEKVVEWIKKN
jgi:uncharacterized membrane protein